MVDPKHGDVQPGGRATRGPEPDPGGEETPAGLVPPYEGRSTGFGEDELSEQLEGTVERQYGGVQAGGAGQTASPAQESPVRPDEVSHDAPGSPRGVGVSTSRSAEEVAKSEGKEPGREDTGVEHPSERPTGTSSARDSTGVHPQEPREGAPNLPSGDQGG
jgi:hypothetical protein